MGKLSESSSQPLVEGVRICSPGNVRGNRISPTTLMLTWDEPYGTCRICPDAVGYEVGGDGITAQSIVKPPCEVRGLNPDNTYWVGVRARSGAGVMSGVTTVPILPLLEAPTRPGIPEPSDITYSSVTLTWAPSTGTLFDDYIFYSIYLNGSIYARTKETHLILRNLRNYWHHRVEIRAYYEGGGKLESESASVTFKTLLRPPILTFRQRNGLGKLSWAPDYWTLPTHEGTVNGHEFSAKPGYLFHRFGVTERAPGPAPHHLKIEVTARVDGEVSAVSKLEVTLTDIIPPGRPGVPVASAIGDTTATLTWTPPTDGREVVGYWIALWGLQTGQEQYVTATRHTYHDLPAGGRYLFVVRAQDRAGNRSVASEVMFKTSGAPTVPMEPRPPHVMIIPKSSTSAQLQWMFQDVVSACVRISLNGEYHSDVFFRRSTLLENLTPGDEYVITVIAYVPRHLILSEPTTLVYESKDVTPPSVPGNLRSIGSAPYSVTLAWEESSDDTGVYGYAIYNNFEYCDDVLVTTYTATDLYPGEHLFHVRALDFFGNASEPAVLCVKVTGDELPA